MMRETRKTRAVVVRFMLGHRYAAHFWIISALAAAKPRALALRDTNFAPRTAARRRFRKGFPVSVSPTRSAGLAEGDSHRSLLPLGYPSRRCQRATTASP